MWRALSSSMMMKTFVSETLLTSMVTDKNCAEPASVNMLMSIA